MSEAHEIGENGRAGKGAADLKAVCLVHTYW